MTTNQNTQNNDTALASLLDEAKKINQNIDVINEEAEVAMSDIDAKVDAGIADIENTFSELDQVEKEGGDELDKLIEEEEAEQSS